MRKVKRRVLGKKDNGGEVKVCPDIEIGGALKVNEEHVGFGSSGATRVHNGAKPTAGIIADNQPRKEIEEISGLQARLQFFDEFFSDNNKMSLGRVLVYDKGYPRRYTVVKFDVGNFKSDSSYILDPSAMPIPLTDYENGLEEYLRYLYINMVKEVQYFEGIVDEEFQNMIKALYVNKDLTMVEHNLIDSKNLDKAKNPVICLTDRKNALCWFKKDVIPVLTDEYLKAVKSRYETATDGRVNEPDLSSLYDYFKENDKPDMQVLELGNASDNPFRNLYR